jgi:hypothetical protein
MISSSVRMSWSECQRTMASERVEYSRDMLAPADESGVFARASFRAALAGTHLENDHGGGFVVFLKERSE